MAPGVGPGRQVTGRHGLQVFLHLAQAAVRDEKKRIEQVAAQGQADGDDDGRGIALRHKPGNAFLQQAVEFIDHLGLQAHKRIERAVPGLVERSRPGDTGGYRIVQRVDLLDGRVGLELGFVVGMSAFNFADRRLGACVHQIALGFRGAQGACQLG